MPFLQRVASLHSSDWAPLLIRAILYALAITALVVYAPSEEHVFIYQGF
jgi:hypothetical protein